MFKPNSKYLIIILLAFASCFASDRCYAGPADKKSDITVVKMSNATYFLPVRSGSPQPITMTNGSGNRGKMLMVGMQSGATGDLNGDKIADGAVVYWLNLGDENYWRLLAVFLSKDGEAINVATKQLGMVNLESLRIENGKVIVTYTGNNGGKTAPLKSTETYVLKGDQLTQVENAPVVPSKDAKPENERKKPLPSRNLS